MARPGEELRVARARATAAALGAVLALAGLPGRAEAVSTELFFSEYIEGTSNNKALEIYNGTGAPVDLAAGAYNLQMYFNGSNSPGLTINLVGTVADEDVFVLAHSSAAGPVLAEADQTNGAGWFNGDDAVALRVGTSTIDVIGQVGLDPGTEWGTGLTSTADNTLRRKPQILQGDTNGSDAFDPGVEWDGFPTDTFNGLGAHTTEADGAPVIADCDGPLVTTHGTPATTGVNASDADGRVIDMQITSVTPSPVPGTITLENLVAAAGVGDTATADVTVDAAAPANTYTVRVTATNDDPTPQIGICSLTVQVKGPPTLIREVQGSAHISPLVGSAVFSVPGIVTAVRSNGFFFQDPDPDADPATSEGLFVFTSSAPAVTVGDDVLVDGTVAEFRPGGASGTNLTTTELAGPSVTVASSGTPLPAATVVGSSGRVPPSAVIEDDAAGSVETSGTFDPASDGIDFYESLESMIVQVDDAVAVGPRNTFGEIPVVGDDGANASLRTPRGGVVIRPGDFNPERIILDDALAVTPPVNVGDHFATPLAGVVDYSFGNFKLLVTSSPTPVSGALARERAAAASAGQLSVASFNVENLDPGDGSRIDELAGEIVNNLNSPDLIGLQEVQDNNGPTNDSVVDADATYAALIAAVQAAGGPSYDFRQIDPVDDQDGGQPGGNIRVGFLFRTDRGLAFVDRPGGTATAATTVVGGTGGPELSFSPGRIDPTNPAFTDSRKALVGEFTFSGEKIFVVTNHFNSKGGDDPLFGRFQPPTLSSEVQRNQQAQVVNDFVDSILALAPDARVVVFGDLNDFEFSTPLATLKGGVLTDLVDTLPQEERYSYVFDGNSQTLDHILVSNGLAAEVVSYDAVHMNAEFAERPTDHDPPVALLCADSTAPSLSVSASPSRLFPPNHKYVTVNTSISAADASGTPSVTLVSVTSNEPDNAPGPGDGNTTNDIDIVDDDTFRLRAERDESGSGRVYTITYQATDACGNTTTAGATVTVPVGLGD